MRSYASSPTYQFAGSHDITLTRRIRLINTVTRLTASLANVLTINLVRGGVATQIYRDSGTYQSSVWFAEGSGMIFESGDILRVNNTAAGTHRFFFTYEQETSSGETVTISVGAPQITVTPGVIDEGAEGPSEI